MARQPSLELVSSREGHRGARSWAGRGAAVEGGGAGRVTLAPRERSRWSPAGALRARLPKPSTGCSPPKRRAWTTVSVGPLSEPLPGRIQINSLLRYQLRYTRCMGHVKGLEPSYPVWLHHPPAHRLAEPSTGHGEESTIVHLTARRRPSDPRSIAECCGAVRGSRTLTLQGAYALNVVCMPFHHHGNHPPPREDTSGTGTRARTWIRGFKGLCSAIELSPCRQRSQRRDSNSRRRPHEGHVSPRVTAQIRPLRSESNTE